MRHALVFTVLGVAFLALAVQSAGSAGWPWVAIAVIEAYFAVSLFTLAAAYALKQWGVPVEDVVHSGPWRRVIGVLVLPYRSLARVVVAWMHWFDAMELMHAVGDRLYVGRAPRRSDQDRLSSAGVTSVLNLCIELPPAARLRNQPGLELNYLPVLDGTAPSTRQFQQALEWIAGRHAAGHTVLVHCAQGRGRSVTIVAAALCKLGLANGPDEALAMIIAARPKARPSSSQRRALRRYLEQAS